jgi:hypothetical protein
VKVRPSPDYRGGTVEYKKESGLVLHEAIERLTDEEFVRAYLVVRLVKTLRYPATQLELEYTYTIGRPSRDFWRQRFPSREVSKPKNPGFCFRIHVAGMAARSHKGTLVEFLFMRLFSWRGDI